MKTLLTLITIVLVTTNANGQTDSARLKVTRARSADNKTYYWLKDIDTKENYFTVCECYQKHEKGDIVVIARRDIEIINEGKPVSWKRINN